MDKRQSCTHKEPSLFTQGNLLLLDGLGFIEIGKDSLIVTIFLGIRRASSARFAVPLYAHVTLVDGTTAFCCYLILGLNLLHEMLDFCWQVGT